MFKLIRQTFGIFFFFFIFLRINLYDLDLYEYKYYTYVLGFYILTDVTFKIDFLFHHILSIMACIFYNYYLFPLIINSNDEFQIQTFKEWNKSIFLLETSTIFLNLIYMGYKNFLTKTLFFFSFVYFRNIRFTFKMLNNDSYLLMNKLSNDNYYFYFIYYSIFSFCLLNYYWLILIIKKYIK